LWKDGTEDDNTAGSRLEYLNEQWEKNSTDEIMAKISTSDE
jgi:hypothetical protein